MQSETKICQNCRQNFVIEPADFEYYKKIVVPPPTFCPDCRLQRRMAFLNERTFYKRACDLCKRDIIALCPADSPFPVYCAKCFWDKWDPLTYGVDVDFSKPFFQQIKELLAQVPHTGQQQITPTMINSDFCCVCSHLKNCYLVINSDFDDDCGYSTALERSKQCYDTYMCDECEMCAHSVNLKKCYRTFHSFECQDCVDIAWSKNLIGCTNCIGCVNLRKQQYCIFNQAYSKEEYFKKVAEYKLDTYAGQVAFAKQFAEFAAKFPNKYMSGTHNSNVQAEYADHCKNVSKSFQVLGTEESKYCSFLYLAPTHDSYDITMWGGNATRMYECMGAGGGQNDVKFCFECWTPAQNMEYSFGISGSCADLFGCYALMNKKYCILNKQYTKEEYEALLPKIKKHMEEMPYVDAAGNTYRYGEFFPPEFSTFMYNESLAQEYFPLTKERALAAKYNWREEKERNYTVTLPTEKIPEIAAADEEILKQVIGCEHANKCDERCSGAFRLIPQELNFYRQMKLPLPRLCPNCRHYGRLKQRNPIKFWQRQCMCKVAKHAGHVDLSCSNTFETSYAPERPEIVYCEQCYQAEVA